MTTKTYPADATGILFIDPYNDFLSEGGKLWPRLKETIEANNLLEHLRQIIIGMVANTCVEATGRFAMELGYHVTLVKDATGAFGPEMMHAAHVLNAPTFAHAIVTTSELLASF